MSSNQATLQNMQTKLKAMGGLSDVLIGEPKNLPSSPIACIIPTRVRIDETTLQSPRLIHTVTIRFYNPMLQEPYQDIEFMLDDLRDRIWHDIMGDFDLGGTIAYPVPLDFTARYGYDLVGQTWFRMLDLEVGYRIDDSATFAA